MTSEGTEWTVDRIVRVTDGDTVRLFRSRPEERDGRHYRLADDPAEEPDGVPIRLVWVDTPERGRPGYGEARSDLIEWVGERDPVYSGNASATGLRVVCYESGGWDRLMGDLLDADGNSASQWLMTVKGWPPYVRGNR